MRKEIIEVLDEVKPGVDYENETSLITDEIITSFDVVMLISLLNAKFSIKITPMDLLPENFESIDSIENLINKLK